MFVGPLVMVQGAFGAPLVLRFAPMRGIYFLKRQTTFVYTVIYKIGYICFAHKYFQFAAKYRRCSWLHNLSYFFQKLSAYASFLKKTISLVFYHRPQRPGRLPRGPPLVPPLGGGPSHRDRICLLSCLDRPVLCAAGLAGGNCRADSPAAIAGAVPAWAAAAGSAVRPLQWVWA